MPQPELVAAAGRCDPALVGRDVEIRSRERRSAEAVGGNCCAGLGADGASARVARCSLRFVATVRWSGQVDREQPRPCASRPGRTACVGPSRTGQSRPGSGSLMPPPPAPSRGSRAVRPRISATVHSRLNVPDSGPEPDTVWTVLWTEPINGDLRTRRGNAGARRRTRPASCDRGCRTVTAGVLLYRFAALPVQAGRVRVRRDRGGVAVNAAGEAVELSVDDQDPDGRDDGGGGSDDSRNGRELLNHEQNGITVPALQCEAVTAAGSRGPVPRSAARRGSDPALTGAERIGGWPRGYPIISRNRANEPHTRRGRFADPSAQTAPPEQRRTRRTRRRGRAVREGRCRACDPDAAGGHDSRNPRTVWCRCCRRRWWGCGSPRRPRPPARAEAAYLADIADATRRRWGSERPQHGAFLEVTPPRTASAAAGVERRVIAHSGRIGLTSELTSRGASKDQRDARPKTGRRAAAHPASPAPVWTVRTRTPCGAPDDRRDPQPVAGADAATLQPVAGADGTTTPRIRACDRRDADRLAG